MRLSVGFARAALHGMCVASFIVCAAPAYAASIVVNSLADSSGGPECTLRDAITAANTDAPVGGCTAGDGADTITFAQSGEITLSRQLPRVISGSTITIDGGGKTIVISGDNATAVIEVQYGVLTLLHLTVANSRSDLGAIVVQRPGTLTVDYCVFSGNNGQAGGAIFSGQATIDIRNSTFVNNSAIKGGGIYNGSKGALHVDNSTFLGNTATEQGGGLYTGDTASMLVTNSTFSGNSAPSGGAGAFIGHAGGFFRHSTIAGNAGSGVMIGDGGSLDLANSIVAGNTGGDCQNVGRFSQPATTTPKLIADGSCNLDGAISGDPMLGPLANHGGPTLTYALLPNSPAIDAGAPGVCADLDADQRGAPRSVDGDFDGNAACDLGAFEFADQPPSAAADAYTTNTSTPLAVAAPGVLANDDDPDDDAMTAVLVSPPAHAAAFRLEANGSFTYTPAADYTGADGFTYTARDAAGATSTVAAVTITVAVPSCGILVTPATLAQPYVAIPYLQSIGTNATGKYTYSVTAGALPPGLQLVSVLGVTGVVGIPQTPGTYAFTITAAKSGSSCRASRSYTVTIPPTVVPLLTCVQKINKTTYRATFGFDNTTGAGVTIPVGANNAFTPGAQNRGQVTAFSPGTATNAFTVTFTNERQDNDLALWVLRGPDNQKRVVTITKSTYGCS